MADSLGTVRLVLTEADADPGEESVITVPQDKLPQAQSWLAGGANDPITAEQLLAVVDPDSLTAVAEEAGVEPAVFAEKVADALPGLIDDATPDGELNPQFSVRIVGGDEVEPHSHPHQISLRL
ncbi:YidB family protein [Catellatospora tritici]|uniref:YidB family protein n=1 Tax=Catellatospora tritici TaxID=2851566 RepID=UPI001C2D4B95|nr:YidB family protein [Catellatospora tritici]MBV1855948.1 hypothetical protein [Catellatospora tritici]